MARKFIERKTKDAHPDDLIVLAGDFNVNGQKDKNCINDHLKEILKKVTLYSNFNNFVSLDSRGWQRCFSMSTKK